MFLTTHSIVLRARHVARIWPGGRSIGVGTRGDTWPWSPHFSTKKLFLKSFPSFGNTIFIQKRLTRTRRAQICVEMYRRGVSFCSRSDRSFTGPFTFGDVPTPLGRRLLWAQGDPYPKVTKKSADLADYFSGEAQIHHKKKMLKF